MSTCPICLEEDRPMRSFRCNHGVCLECCSRLRSAACALCRADNREDFRLEELAEMARLSRRDRTAAVEQEHRELRHRLTPRVRLTAGDWDAIIARVARCEASARSLGVQTQTS